RPDRAARAPGAPAVAPRRDRLGPLGSADEAPRVRPRRQRLPQQAVLVRRAARPRARAATAGAPAGREPRARGHADAGPGTPAGPRRRARGLPVGPGVPPSAPPR